MGNEHVVLHRFDSNSLLPALTQLEHDEIAVPRDLSTILDSKLSAVRYVRPPAKGVCPSTVDSVVVLALEDGTPVIHGDSWLPVDWRRSHSWLCTPCAWAPDGKWGLRKLGRDESLLAADIGPHIRSVLLSDPPLKPSFFRSLRLGKCLIHGARYLLAQPASPVNALINQFLTGLVETKD